MGAMSRLKVRGAPRASRAPTLRCRWPRRERRRCPALLVVWLLLVLASGSAWAKYKGAHWADENYETYKVKRIGLVVAGTWSGSDAKVDPR